MYWFRKQRKANENNREGLLDNSSGRDSYNDENSPNDTTEIDLEEKKWVRREVFGVVIAVIAWATWIIVFQILKDYFPSGWLVRSEDPTKATGW